MNIKKNEDMPRGICLIAWYYIIWSVFLLFLIPGLIISMKNFESVGKQIAWMFGFIPLICIAIFSIIVARKFMRGTKWSRKALIFIASLYIMFGVQSILNILLSGGAYKNITPSIFQIIINIIVIYYLTRIKTKEYFQT